MIVVLKLYYRKSQIIKKSISIIGTLVDWKIGERLKKDLIILSILRLRKKNRGKGKKWGKL
jgi:hypothetical protein